MRPNKLPLALTDSRRPLLLLVPAEYVHLRSVGVSAAEHLAQFCEHCQAFLIVYSYTR